MPGHFIVLEGPDGSGTTTHAQLLEERLKSEGYDVLRTAEPTDGPVGRYIRELLKTGAIDPMELQHMFCMDRQWHIDTIIEPALRDGKVVLCDRYFPSTIVYAEAQGLDATQLKLLNNNFIRPDCMIFALPPLEVSLKRMMKRAEKDVFEREELQKKIYAGYEAMAQEDPSIRVVDTSKEKPVTAEEIWQIVRGCLGE